MIRDQKDFLTGLLFGLAGAATVWIGSGYRTGSAAEMGPGYFPLLLGGILLLLALVLIIRSLRAPHMAFGQVRWRPVIAITAGAVLFALLVRPAGLFAALAVSTFVASQADRSNRPLPALFFALAIAAGNCLLFVTLLGQPIPIFGSWTGG